MAEIIPITDQQFRHLALLITSRYGIKFPEEKKLMFQARLQKRLRSLQFSSFQQYAHFIYHSPEGANELEIMADLLSTNKTDFFREPDHFDYFRQMAVPQLLNMRKRTLNIWSAGCSSGKEAYSLAIVLEEMKNQNPDYGFDYRLIATDISGRMLERAARAIYAYDKIRMVPEHLRSRYFLKSKDQSDPRVRVCKAIRDKVTFQWHNLMDEHYAFPFLFDVVFLRNTLIYFDRSVQQSVLHKVLYQMEQGGYLFIGHSESVIKHRLPLLMVAPGVYRKTEVK